MHTQGPSAPPIATPVSTPSIAHDTDTPAMGEQAAMVKDAQKRRYKYTMKKDPGVGISAARTYAPLTGVLYTPRVLWASLITTGTTSIRPSTKYVSLVYLVQLIAHMGHIHF